MTEKPIILLWGACQSRMLGLIIGEMPSITGRFELSMVDSFPDPTTGIYQLPGPGVLDRCEYLLYQQSSADLVPDYVSRLVAQGKAVRFPFVFCYPIWPQHVPGNRGRFDPEWPFGRFPYGDRVLLDLMESEPNDIKVVDQYMRTDVAAMFNVDRLIGHWEYQLNEFDTGCDVRLATYLQQHWRAKRLFWTFHHPTNDVFAFTLGHLILRTFGPLISTSEITEALSKHQLNQFEAPIHPSIARAIGLQWFREDARYGHPGAGFLSIREWALKYVQHSREVLAWEKMNGAAFASPKGN